MTFRLANPDHQFLPQTLKLMQELDELFGVAIVFKGLLVFQPGAPHFQPLFVMPVMPRRQFSSTQLQVDLIFLSTARAQWVSQHGVVSFIRFLNLRTTPGTFELTPSTLKDFSQHLDLFILQRIFFLAEVLLAPLLQFNYICHSSPPTSDSGLNLQSLAIGASPYLEYWNTGVME